MEERGKLRSDYRRNGQRDAVFLALKLEGGSHKPRKGDSFLKLERAMKQTSPQKSPEGVQLYQRFVVSSVRAMWDF